MIVSWQYCPGLYVRQEQEPASGGNLVSRTQVSDCLTRHISVLS